MTLHRSREVIVVRAIGADPASTILVLPHLHATDGAAPAMVRAVVGVTSGVLPAHSLERLAAAFTWRYFPKLCHNTQSSLA